MLLHEAVSKADGSPIRRISWESYKKIMAFNGEFLYASTKNLIYLNVESVTATDWEVCSPFLSQMQKGQKFSFLDGECERFTRVFPVMPIYHKNGKEIKYLYCGENNILYYTNDDFPVTLVKD